MRVLAFVLALVLSTVTASAQLTMLGVGGAGGGGTMVIGGAAQPTTSFLVARSVNGVNFTGEATTATFDGGTQSRAMVACGSKIFAQAFGTNVQVLSTDGVTWANRALAMGTITGDKQFSCTQSGNFLVAAGTRNAYTTDGTAAPTALTVPGTGGSFNGVGIGNGITFILGLDGSSNPTIFTSPDSTTWTQRTTSLTAGSSAVKAAYVGSTYVVFQAGTAWGWSTNLTTWNVGTAFTGNYGSVVVNPSATMMVAFRSGGNCYSSTDGQTFTARTCNVGTENFNGGTYFNGRFYGVTSSGHITSSADGITWDASPIQPYGAIVLNSAVAIP